MLTIINSKYQIKVQADKKKYEEDRNTLQEKMTKWSNLEPEFEKRGITMGRPLYIIKQYEGEVYKSESGELHWPVLFLYEEHNQSDFIQDFNENHCFQDHLSYMFPPSSPFAAWDTDKKYVLENLEIYFEAGCTLPLKQTSKVYKKRWIKVKQTTTLGKALSHPDCIIPRLPVFYIVVANSPFRQELLKRELE